MGPHEGLKCVLINVEVPITVDARVTDHEAFCSLEQASTFGRGCTAVDHAFCQSWDVVSSVTLSCQPHLILMRIVYIYIYIYI